MDDKMIQRYKELAEKGWENLTPDEAVELTKIIDLIGKAFILFGEMLQKMAQVIGTTKGM